MSGSTTTVSSGFRLDVVGLVSFRFSRVGGALVAESPVRLYLTPRLLEIRSAEVNSPTYPSTYPLLLLTQRISQRICVGIDFFKTTSKTLCVK